MEGSAQVRKYFEEFNLHQPPFHFYYPDQRNLKWDKINTAFVV